MNIAQYGFWFFEAELTENLRETLKNFTKDSEINNLDYFEMRLNENLKLVTDRLEELTADDSNRKVSLMFSEMFYRFFYNKFLFYLTLDAVKLPTYYNYDFEIRGAFIKYDPKNGYSIDKSAIDKWLGAEFTIPLLLMFVAKAINSKWLEAWFKNVKTGNVSKKIDTEMFEQIKQIDSPEKSELIDKIKTAISILKSKKDKKPYTLSRICKIMDERYGSIKYTTLRDKMKKFKIPTDLKKFTEIYG